MFLEIVAGAIAVGCVPDATMHIYALGVGAVNLTIFPSIIMNAVCVVRGRD